MRLFITILLGVLLLLTGCSSSDTPPEPQAPPGEQDTTAPTPQPDPDEPAPGEPTPDTPPPDDTTPSNPPPGNGGTDPGSVDNSNWQLQPGHFISAKMPPVIIYPRPDAETQSWARHRKTYPGLTYRVPVAVQGGAWPFKYELTAAPAGMFIGEFWDNGDYGVITWPNPLEGIYPVSVQVTDQSLTTVTVSWQLVVSKDKTLFLSPQGDNTNPGTLESPMRTNSAWHLNNDNDTTYDGYHIIYREGRYSFDGMSAHNNNIRLHSGKPMVLLAYPGETPVFDMSSGKFMGFTVGSQTGPHDLFVGGIRFEDGDQSDANAHFFWLTGSSTTRVTLFENYFYNLGPGTAGTDNTSVCFVSENATRKKYFAYIGNVYDDLGASGNGVSAFDHYYTDYTVFENNEFKNNQGRFGAWSKSHNDLITVRRNTGRYNPAGVEGLINFSAYNELPNAQAEICWNFIESTNPASFQGSIVWIDQEVLGKGSAWVYRNTFIGNIHSRTAGSATYPRVAENNVVISGGNVSGISNFDNIDNLIGKTGDGIIDANGQLQNTYRDSHLGTHGWEVQ